MVYSHSNNVKKSGGICHIILEIIRFIVSCLFVCKCLFILELTYRYMMNNNNKIMLRSNIFILIKSSMQDSVHEEVYRGSTYIVILLVMDM